MTNGFSNGKKHIFKKVILKFVKIYLILDDKLSTVGTVLNSESYSI